MTRLGFRISLVMALAAFGAPGCARESVVRLAGGELHEGPLVSPGAYEAFLSGALAEESGDLRKAASEYRRAARLGPTDPEVLSRLAWVLCSLDPRSSAADRAFAQAFRADEEFEGAHARRAECARLRGEPEGVALASARAARAQRPGRVEGEALLLRGSAPGQRERALALTMAHGEHPAAWEALADHALSSGELALEVRALVELARRTGPGCLRASSRAVGLLELGASAEARRIASSVIDAEVGPCSPPLSLRLLALDEALLSGDPARVRKRAVRTHLGLDQVAARALLMGDRSMAAAFSAEVLASDPASSGAAIVSALASPGQAQTLPEARARVPLEAAALLALQVARVGEVGAASRLLSLLPHAEASGHDVLLLPLLVELGARGIAPFSILPPDARVELAARGLPSAMPPAGAPLDAPHALLRSALEAPGAPATAFLRARVAQVAPTHPLLVVADARIALAGGGVPGDALVRRAASLVPDALALRTIIALADARSDRATGERARTVLHAMALTEDEKRLASLSRGVPR